MHFKQGYDNLLEGNPPFFEDIHIKKKENKKIIIADANLASEKIVFYLLVFSCSFIFYLICWLGKGVYFPMLKKKISKL